MFLIVNQKETCEISGVIKKKEYFEDLTLTALAEIVKGQNYLAQRMIRNCESP